MTRGDCSRSRMHAASSSEVLPRDESQLHADAARLSIVPAGHPMGYVDAFAGLVRDVYDTINGRLIDGKLPVGVPMFADGLRASQVTEAVLRSAKANAWVTLPSENASA